MKTTFQLVICLCLILLGGAFTPAASAAPLPAAAAGSLYLTLTGLDFYPVDSDMTYSENNGGLYAVDLLSGFGFSAAIHLPDGASVTAITFYLLDDSASDLNLSVTRYDPATGISSVISGLSSSGASASSQELSLTSGLPFTVDNSTYAYRLRVEFTEAGMNLQRLYGARISYTPPATPPAVDYITLAGTDLRSTSSLMTYTCDGGTLYATTLDPSHSFGARLDLPQDALVDQIDWYVIDNHASYLYLSLVAHYLATNTVTTPASATTDGTTPSEAIQHFSASPAISIDNTIRAYSIRFTPWDASSNLRVVGARVRYHPPQGGTPASGVISISGLHFFPSGSNLTYKAYGSAVYALALASGRTFQASVRLPQGARIDRVTYYYIDNSTQEILFSVRQYTPATPTFATLSSGVSSGAETTLRTRTFDDLGSVDNAAAITRLLVGTYETGQPHQLVGAQVEYSFLQTYLPLISR